MSDTNNIVIDAGEIMFLETFEDFVDIILPFINDEREQRGLPPLDPDEQTNTFLELRAKYGVQ